MVRVVEGRDLEEGDSTDSSIDLDYTQNVSMATSAAAGPGASLSDKLRLAASKGQVDKVQELLGAGATFESDREGRTALHYAALNGHGEVVQILADDACNVDSQDKLGYTALHRASAQGHLEVLKVLLCEGCLVDRQDEVHGNSPLHEASWNGYSKTLELLIRHKANVHCINKAGFSALHLAAQNGHNQSARVLLYAGCNADSKNNYGDTPLHTAARYGHAGVTRILISARCKISEQNKNGDTSLHIAAALKRRKIAKVLTESGINTSVKNKQSETAVDVARRKEYPEIILIVTAQSKEAKKKRKQAKKAEKGSKLVLNNQSDDEKKPSLFFKKKTKAKDKEPATEKEALAVRSARAPSELSSSEFTSHMTPEDLLRGFRQHVVGKNPGKENQGSESRGAENRPRGPHPKKPVHGLVTDYESRQGTQLYKDLAGNVKKGPIGYAPVCNCQPIIKKMEKKMEADRNNLYDHIDASHRTLTDRIEGLDKRSAQHVYSMDKLTRERIDAVDGQHQDYVHSCLRKERAELEHHYDERQTRTRTELKDYLDHRFTNFERYYSTTNAKSQRGDNCHWCHDDEAAGQPRYHQDDMLNRKYMHYDPQEPPMPGRLYKSKSDESLASSHPSRRHWKLRSNPARDLADLRMNALADEAKRQERQAERRARRAEQPPRGRTPEGHSRSDLHAQPEYASYQDYVDQRKQWNAKRTPIDPALSQQLGDSQPQESQVRDSQPLYRDHGPERRSGSWGPAQREGAQDSRPRPGSAGQRESAVDSRARATSAEPRPRSNSADPWARESLGNSQQVQADVHQSQGVRGPPQRTSGMGPDRPQARPHSAHRHSAYLEGHPPSTTAHRDQGAGAQPLGRSQTYDSHLASQARPTPLRDPNPYGAPPQHRDPRAQPPTSRQHIPPRTAGQVPQHSATQGSLPAHQGPQPAHMGPQTHPVSRVGPQPSHQQSSQPTHQAGRPQYPGPRQGGPGPQSQQGGPGLHSQPPQITRPGPPSQQAGPQVYPSRTQGPTPQTSASSLGVTSPVSTSSLQFGWHPKHTSSPDPQTGLSPGLPQTALGDCGSNPDSGYGSRLYQRGMAGGPPPGSASSSFQSARDRSSLGTSLASTPEGPSPLLLYSKEPRAQRATPPGAPQQPRQGPTGQQPRGPQGAPTQQARGPQGQAPPAQQHRAPQSQLQQARAPQGVLRGPQPQGRAPQGPAQNKPKNGVPDIVNRWYEPKQKDPSVERSRMWPPVRGERTSGPPEGGQAQRDAAGLVGKATQV